MNAPPFIYLASQSPRRRQLLGQLGVRHELLLPGADEDAEGLEAVRPGELPAAYVQRVTGLKLDAALARRRQRGLPAAPVLCADTTVAVGRRILGKPTDAAEAAAMLTALSGCSHRVRRGVGPRRGPVDRPRQQHLLGGQSIGETDEFGLKAIKDRVSVNDFHATILHLLGLDHEQLTVRHNGRDERLTDVAGEVVSAVYE